MKTEHALRYLLLRTLKGFAGAVPPELLLEVTRSLHVVAERERYVVTWQTCGRSRERIYGRDAFVFYRRGDTRSEGRTVDEPLSNQNAALARAFAEEVFGVPAPAPRTGWGKRHEPHQRYGVLEAGALALAVGVAGRLGVATALVLLALNLVEYVAAGRRWASALWLPLALVGPPAAALLGAATYGLLQLLDPDPTYRRARVALCTAAALAAGVELAFARHAIEWAPGVVVVAGLAMGAAVARSLYAMHFRTMPLALPFYVLGLYLDGERTASFIGLCVVWASAVVTAYGYRWVPVQRERALTPNG